MPRTDEAESFFFAVYSAVQEIPPGQVTSYGHIAMLIGTPQRPRQVGVCLKHLPSASDGTSRRFHDGNVPWQRVLNAKGVISLRGGDGGDGRVRQAAALRAEGVQVVSDAMGELSVNLREYGWFPRRLPSEVGAAGRGGNGADEPGNEDERDNTVEIREEEDGEVEIKVEDEDDAAEEEVPGRRRSGRIRQSRQRLA